MHAQLHKLGVFDNAPANGNKTTTFRIEGLENISGSLEHEERELRQSTFTVVLPELDTDVH